MKLTPYWLDTATPSGDYRRNPVPERADIAIVGAGFTGLSAALEAAQHGARVVVLDSHTVGWGASGRNGGMATTGLAIGLGKAIKRYGRPAGAGDVPRSTTGPSTPSRSSCKEHSIDCDFQRSGKLTLAMNAKQVGQMRKTQQTLADLADYPVTVVDKQDLHSEIGSDFYAGGMVDPLGAGVHVGKFVHGLAEAGARAGVTLCENAQVTQLAARPGGGHDVHTTPRRRPCRPGPDRDQRLHRIADAVAAAADHPGRQLHHRDRAAAAGNGPADPAPQPAGLRQQDAHLLLPHHPGHPAALRGTGQVRAVQPRLGPQERRDPASAR